LSLFAGLERLLTEDERFARRTASGRAPAVLTPIFR